MLLALVGALESLADEPEEGAPEIAEIAQTIDQLSAVLGARRLQGAEVLSKLLALLLPECVPLLPEAACKHLLDAPPAEPGLRFVRALLVFRRATNALYTELVAIARDHRAAVLDVAQVLDRVLWFDSEGHAHFPPLTVAEAPRSVEGGEARDGEHLDGAEQLGGGRAGLRAEPQQLAQREGTVEENEEP